MEKLSGFCCLEHFQKWLPRRLKKVPKKYPKKYLKLLFLCCSPLHWQFHLQNCTATSHSNLLLQQKCSCAFWRTGLSREEEGEPVGGFSGVCFLLWLGFCTLAIARVSRKEKYGVRGEEIKAAALTATQTQNGPRWPWNRTLNHLGQDVHAFLSVAIYVLFLLINFWIW